MWTMPPTCRATAPGAFYGASRLPGDCRAAATHTVTAYALTTPGLPALYAEDACARHAQALADHWQRHGLRRPRRTSVARVLARVAPGLRGTLRYPTELAPPLPGMPDTGPPAPKPTRPAADYGPVVLYSTDHGGRWARCDIDPSDRNRDGKTRREMIVTLARAYDTDPTPAMSLNGPWADRLNLRVFGREAHVIALRRALPWLLGHAESSCRCAMRDYTAWLRRQPEGHHGDNGLPTMRRAWRRDYLTAWTSRWATRAYAAAAGQDQPHRAGEPRQDQAVYPADVAARHDADELWRQLQRDSDRDQLAARIATQAEKDTAALGRRPDTPTDTTGPIAAPGILQPPAAPGPVDYGRRTRRIPALRVQLARQLPLWDPPGHLMPVPPVPARRPRPDTPPGRPLLEVLLDETAH